ncbi:MAG: AraC family transcriptional regulator [Clostridiales bacterium]|nr:AraC family transcriptional regulator [Clostridiales bacterium]
MRPCEPYRIDETMRELSAHGTEQFPFQYFISRYGGGADDRFPWHWHREVEIVLVDTGEAHCLIGAERITLRRGEGLFIQSGVIHSYEAPDGVVMPTLLFAPELIAPPASAIHRRAVEPFLSAGLSHALLRQEVGWQRQVLDAVRALDRITREDGPTMELDAHAAVCGLWSALFRHREEIRTLSARAAATQKQARLRRMIAHLEDHYASRLRLEEIARVASVSVSEALRCFREGVRTTPMAYLNRLRLDKARSQLLNTNLSVTAIAMACGFSSAAYFDRMFAKQYGASPSAYRLRHGTDGDPAD